MRICQHIFTLRNKGGECDAETTWFRAYSREQWPVFYRQKLKQNSYTKTRLLRQKENYQQQMVMAGDPRVWGDWTQNRCDRNALRDVQLERITFDIFLITEENHEKCKLL
jgi:hypothetical protein